MRRVIKDSDKPNPLNLVINGVIVKQRLFWEISFGNEFSNTSYHAKYLQREFFLFKEISLDTWFLKNYQSFVNPGEGGGLEIYGIPSRDKAMAIAELIVSND